MRKAGFDLYCRKTQEVCKAQSRCFRPDLLAPLDTVSRIPDNPGHPRADAETIKNRDGSMPKKLWAIYRAMWSITALLLIVDLIWMRRSNVRIETASAMQGARIVALVAAITGLLWIMSRRSYGMPARKTFYQNAASLFMWITLLAAFTHVGIVFQYLCVSAAFPLVSNVLVSADHAIGFHWLQAYRWVATHRWIHVLLELAYASGGVQLFVIPIILAVTSNTKDYAEFAVQFIVSATLVILIALFIPAESAFIRFDIHDPGTVSAVSDFTSLRSTNTRALTFASAQGLVSFPSLHAILALCLAYALRHVRFVFPVGIGLNSLMILSTPTQGGHYLSDVLAGLVVGLAVIYFVRKIFVEPAYSETPVRSVDLVTLTKPDTADSP